MDMRVNTIFFDHGSTLRCTAPELEFQARAAETLLRLTGADMAVADLLEMLKINKGKLRRYQLEEVLELSEVELWQQFLLPDFPKGEIAAKAAELTRCWRDCDGVRRERAGVRETIKELSGRGYKLGIIANTPSEREIPDWLNESGLYMYFKTVILSSKVRVRKPDPAIYLLAARAIGSNPGECAYIGDNPSRDIEGTLAAGYGMAVCIHEPNTLAKEPPRQEYAASRVIREIAELLEIFPEGA
jgi:HAD superfamily hydrolase (TIGR01549 family)